VQALPKERLVGCKLVPVFQQGMWHGISLAFCGITPNFFWLAKICSRKQIFESDRQKLQMKNLLG
jgi:hypothetical protein